MPNRSQPRRWAILPARTASADGFRTRLNMPAGPGACRRVAASTLVEAPIDPVAGAEVAPDPRQEPGIARIKRMVGKVRSVKGVGSVHLAGNLARRLMAEIGHHRDARSVAAQRVVEIV